jgi:hypothetical protein
MRIEPPSKPEPPSPSPQPLDRLHLADPQVATSVRQALAADGRIVSTAELDLLVSETIEALALATAFGQSVAKGFLRLVGRVAPDRVQAYAHRLSSARRQGAGLGRILAESLPAVLLAGDRAFLAAFDHTLAILLTKGVYALKGPLGLVVRLLDEGEKVAATALLKLLDTCFGLPLTYNRSIYMTQFIPQAVAGFDPRRRPFQIDQLTRVIQVDHHLAEAYLAGLRAGAERLSASALKTFVSRALGQGVGAADGVPAYLALEAHSARIFCGELQTGVTLADLRGQLSRYLQARLGRPVPLRDLEDLGGKWEAFAKPAVPVMVAADGRHLYLPKECAHYANRRQNHALYRTLVKLEAACFEFGSFDFDLERFRHLAGPGAGDAAGDAEGSPSDLELFLQRFPHPALAEALLTLFEHGRLRLALANRYPGLVRRIAPELAQALDQACDTHAAMDPLLPLYAVVALDRKEGVLRRISGQAGPHVASLKAKAEAQLGPGSGVEHSAMLVQMAYPSVAADLLRRGFSPDDSLERFWTPFGRRLRPDLIQRAFGNQDRIARRLRLALAGQGIRLFQSDLRKRLQRQDGVLEKADLAELVCQASQELAPGGAHSNPRPDLSDVDLDALIAQYLPETAPPSSGGPAVFRYPEWDPRLGEYLVRHSLVRERRLPAVNTAFYRRTLARHPGLVARVRHAFELLKPQGLKLLRPWREGDDFDYRAMLNFAVDKKAGRMPSDRLYIKRIKQQRDVAVLLLVDLSRSTANRVQGSRQTVLQVTQTAIVLFCEALQVVGDRFAIAGFSGTGRLGVDYLRVKDFEDPLDRWTEGRIAAMAPLRATRMGAAIRHATRRLAAIPAGVRLLLVLGDGFPNDTDYKGPKAIADTRRAIQEARARRVVTKGITVNLGAHARLDELYGRSHHTVIQDVRDLPDRLFETYGRLTRQ